MKNKLFITALFCTFIYSCSKKQENPIDVGPEYDTVFPGSYFPVYPDSWWKYQLNGSEIVTSTVGEEYQLHFFRMSHDYPDEQLLYSDTVYVPFLDSKPIYGYEQIEWVMPPFGNFYVKWPILSETVGVTFQRNWEDTRYGDFSEKVEVKQKIFNGTDSVLILEGHWVYGPNVKNKKIQEFVKGIGLVKEFIVDTTTLDTLYKKELKEYFVND
jgi:hypothetical protein